MKLVVVSAHYPPDFVSGGTLVPQRTSRELRYRGVDTHVYAGWLGADRRPLEAWDESDETGLPLRWIAIRPFIDWSETANFSNPGVTADFAEYLDRLQPDIVHFHSLQTLGAGLVHAAADRGLRVVITLHDFWWWCARQFLCDRDYRPCSLVVNASACECQVDRRWLDERSAVTLPALARADRLVAVSEISSRVAIANGADPDRLVVIENGVVAGDAGATARPTSDANGILRLVYAGGPDRMKG
ncbi:MAG: glycosyltransferase, partial [Actinomycetota bacterium]|nr:glycosyltransferase [Actinomycetota bacterium]